MTSPDGSYIINSATDWPMTVARSSARLLLFLLVWFNALWVFDSPAALSPGFLLANFRAAIWLYLLEFLTDLYRSRVPPNSREFWLAQTSRLLAMDLVLTVAHILLRGGIVYVATTVLLAIPSPFWFLPYLAALIPSLIGVALRKYVQTRESSPTTGVIRGGTIMSLSDATQRACGLRSGQGGRP